MACKYIFNGIEYEEAELKELFDNMTSKFDSGSVSTGVELSEPPEAVQTQLAFKATSPLIRQKGEIYNQEVFYDMRLIDALQKTSRTTYPSNNVQGFYNDLIKHGVPKNQLEILKDHITSKGIKEINTVDLITSLLAEISYIVEINIATDRKKAYEAVDGEMMFLKDGWKYSNLGGEYIRKKQGEDYKYVTEDLDYTQFNEAYNSLPANPTQHYSNMTVPGGTNYTENEIATPQIIPSIKGHAQFSTENGIGWFRSDDKMDEEVEHIDGQLIATYGEETKTRRILEVQSDLFQKGRDEIDLIYTIGPVKSGYRTWLEKHPEYDDNPYSKEAEQAYIQYKINRKDNQFLQLLNKDNNWITFFVKSIIQDSAKKGYEKVLFPSGDTAAKVEGHQTLEQFIKTKEDRLQFINKELQKKIQPDNGKYVLTIIAEEGDLSQSFDTLEEAENFQKRNSGWYFKEEELGFKGRGQLISEKAQIEKEIKDAKEGRSKLSAINAFYETTITNILKKQGYNPERITDEYGNGWNEIQIKQEHSSKKILLQTFASEGSKASKETIEKVKIFLKRIGVDIQKLDKSKYGDVNAVADILEKLIQVANGKEDVALTEEAMHFAVELIEASNPALYNSLLNKIGAYQIYKEVLNDYSKNKNYQKDGKPDVIKLKKEAIGKVLAEYFILHNEGSLEKPELLEQSQKWWEKIISWFKGLLDKYKNPFAEAIIEVEKLEGEALEKKYAPIIERIAAKNPTGIYGELIKNKENNRAIISELADQLSDPDSKENALRLLNGDTQLAQDIISAKDSFLQIGNQELTYDRITNTAQLIEKKESLTKKDENGKPVDSYFYKGIEILNRVTDKAKQYYERIFGNASITQTEYQKAVNTIKAEKGTDGHEDIQHAFSVLVKDGKFNPNAVFDNAYVPKTNKEIYKVLFVNLRERLKTYTNAKFLSEVSIVDEKKDIAGTIDLLIIKEDGSLQILDWKFFDLNTDKYNDVPWFKQKAWNIQIGEYKRILSEKYGVPTHMIKGEAIPIKANYIFPGTKDGSKSKPILDSIEIGNVNVKLEERDYLLPVTLVGQDTGNEEINKLLSKLNALHSNLEDRIVKGTEEKAKKAEQLQFIDKAMRHLAVKNTIGPLINQASIYTKDVQSIIDIYNNTYKDRDFTANTPSNEELSQYGIQLDHALDQLDIYTNLDVALESLSGTDVSEEARTAHKELTTVVSDARFLKKALEKTIDGLGEKIANSIGFKDLIKSEPAVGTIARTFNETSKLPTKVIQIMFQKLREAHNLSDVTTNEENRNLEEIWKDYETLAKGKGLTIKNIFSIVMNYAENKLIDQFKGEFYTEAKKALKDRNIKWIRDNVNIVQYKKDLAEKLKGEIERINSRPWTEAEKKIEIEKKRRQYDTSKPDSIGWFLHYYTLRNSPIEEKWTSQEWKTLNEKGNESAKKLYDWIIKINEKAEEAGYLPDNKSARTFLPFVVKSFAEKIIFGGNLTIGESFIRSMTVDEDTVGYGAIDPLTGKPVMKIPRYFVNGTDKELSTNLIKNLAIYNQSLNNFKYISEVEGIAKILGRVERNKGSILTNDFGKAIYDKETGTHKYSETNEKNFELYEKQMATLIYGQKYISSEKFDALLFKVGHSFDKINKFLGVKLFPEGLSDRQFSLNKSIDTLNRYFQQKTLGFNPLPALSNLVGGTLQITINSGKYMNKRELLASQANLMAAAVRGEEGKKLIAAIEYFMPFTGNDNFRKMLHDLSVTGWTENKIQDLLMIMMRGGDKIVQATIFTTLWENSILVDGILYNARDYVRNHTEYKNRYESENIEETEGKFNELVAEVKEKYSLSKQATIDDKGKLQLPIQRDSKEAFKLTNLSQSLSKRATGNLTPADVRGINQTVWGNSFMVFKNWIPSLIDTRFGKLKYTSDLDAYEWGRTRTVARILLKDLTQTLPALVDMITFNTLSLSTTGKIVKGTTKGLEKLQELYEFKRQQYFEQTGKELELTREEFFDMVRQNIRNQAKDTLLTLSFLTMFLAAKSLPPDPDEDPAVINQHKLLVRVLDKISDEVSFYYLPTSFQSMLNGSVMPSVGVFSDGLRVVTHGMTELYGDLFDEDIAQKNYFIKYLAKSFPVTSQMSSYLPLYAPELAKELGIQLGTQARR